MSNSVIQLSVLTEPGQPSGAVLAPVSMATIQFFESFEPASASARVVIDPFDGLSSRDISYSGSLQGSDLRCISQACVSDVSVFESIETLANVDPSLLANSTSAGIMEGMNNHTSLDSLSLDLLSAMPRIQDALSGQLSGSELSQLIADMQAQVLELNSISQDLFGETSGEIAEQMLEISGSDVDSLLASMQIDFAVFAQPELASSSLSFEATLDGLFTSPEAFPLTLDFSSRGSVQEASELFAATGSASSISSVASNSDTDNGLPGSTPGSSDLS